MFNYKLSDYIILIYNLIYIMFKHIIAHKSIQKFYKKIYRKS